MSRPQFKSTLRSYGTEPPTQQQLRSNNATTAAPRQRSPMTFQTPKPTRGSKYSRATTPTLSSAIRTTTPTRRNTATTTTPKRRQQQRYPTPSSTSATAETDTEHFWRSMLQQQQQPPRHIHYRGATTSAYLDSGRSSPTSRTTATGGGTIHLAAPAPVDIDASDVARVEEMLVTGIYTPSHRIQKMEALLSRELEMWDHVISSSSVLASSSSGGGEGGVATTSASSPSLTQQQQSHQLHNNNNNNVSSTALSALMAIHAKKINNAPNNNSDNNFFSSPGATVSEQQSSQLHPVSYDFLKNVHQQQQLQTPTRNNNNGNNTAPNSPTKMMDDEEKLQLEVREKLRILDAEVAATDSECQSLIADLMELQKKQQLQRSVGASPSSPEVSDVNELFVGVQQALSKVQERREKLLGMREKLVNPTKQF